MTQQLLVYQSLWAMERRRPDGQEWALDEKLPHDPGRRFRRLRRAFHRSALCPRGHFFPAAPTA